MRLGIHMPQKGGFVRNVRRSSELGVECIQIFPGNPAAWRLPATSPEEIAERAGCLEKERIYPLVIHTAYLVNLASPDTGVYEKSKELVGSTVERAGLYGAPYVVVHTGSHASSGREKGLRRIIEALEEQVGHWPEGVTLLLENTSGGGNLLGGSFRDLGEILASLRGAPLGVCLDTAHAWGAGYDLSSREGVKATLEELYRYTEARDLKVVHLNDTTVDRGSGKDRHYHIGEGRIGEEGFAALLQESWSPDFPFILETPGIGTSKDKDNLETVKRLQPKG